LHPARPQVPVFETDYAQPGPFEPTTFEMFGVRFGILICYEGVYPFLFKDWSQPDALKAMGADVFLWSIGGMVPDAVRRHALARLASPCVCVRARVCVRAPAPRVCVVVVW